VKSVILLLWFLPLVYLTFAVFYHVFLAVAYFLTADRAKVDAPRTRRYLLFIPAHNEEIMIGRILTSLKSVDYLPEKVDVRVIADNCTDRTAEIARSYGVGVLTRGDESKKGKGFAIAWAMKEVDLSVFDAVVIADADNLIDPNFFHGLDEVMDAGFKAVQCNNCLANSNETAFTKVIHLSRTINNELYHHAKYRIGLSSYLMGNGMCFTTGLLGDHPWATGTIAEDYEYYARLASCDVPVGFAANSRLYHQESRDLRQASKQRLRWSSGRFQVAKRYGLTLIKKGLKDRNFRMIDASFPLILPNLSLMVNMTAAALAAAVVVNHFHPLPFVVPWLIVLITLEVAYFASGMFLARMPVFTFLFALGFAPFFLLWKACIDVLGISGRRAGQWGRSTRV